MKNKKYLKLVEVNSSSDDYDLLFWKKKNNKRKFKIGSGGFLPLDEIILKQLLRDKIKEKVENILDSQIKNYMDSIKKAVGSDVFLNKSEVDYNGCGMKITEARNEKCLFVYMKPKPFAMHDIRLGHEHKWYPFRNPPKVGVLLKIKKNIKDDGNLGRTPRYDGENNGLDDDDVFGERDNFGNRNNFNEISFIGMGDLLFGSIFVEGEFEYIHFSSKKGTFGTFCGTGVYTKRQDETWQQSIVRYIEQGVDVLYNGLTESSMKNHSSFDGVLGERYLHPLSTLEFITESEVESEGLKKTNLYEIVPDRIVR